LRQRLVCHPAGQLLAFDQSLESGAANQGGKRGGTTQNFTLQKHLALVRYINYFRIAGDAKVTL
jgi:hypothetical protein